MWELPLCPRADIAAAVLGWDEMIASWPAAFTVFTLATALTLAAGGSHRARGEEPATAAAKPEAKTDSCPRTKFHVVIDVGHTLGVPGAMSARGVTEYDFNLQLSRDIKKALDGAGFSASELLITATKPWRGLFERAVHANNEHADLLIAIHHDSVPDNLIKKWDYEGQQHEYNDDYPGYALFISNDNPAHAASLQFGHFLGEELEARGLHYTPHYTLPIMGHRRRVLVDAEAGVYRYDQLIVLRATHMPALLLEAGSIVNRQEELELGTPERRALISAAIAAAVGEFCAARAQPVSARLDQHAASPQPSTARKRSASGLPAH
jgi:N-acetylmuramoyl-L-alanine amidase